MNENINIALRVNTQDQSITALRSVSQGLSDVASAATRATLALNSSTNVNQVFRSAPASIIQSSKAVTAYDEVIQGLLETVKETKDKGIIPLFAALPGGFDKSKKAATGFAGEIALIVMSMANGFTSAAGTIGLFDRSISKAGQSLIANTSISFFKAVNKEVDEAISGTTKLSSIIKSVGSVSEPFIEGFLGVGDRRPVLDSLVEKMQRVSRKTSRTLAASISNSFDINKIVDPYLQKVEPDGADVSRMSEERMRRRLTPLQQLSNDAKGKIAQTIQNSDFAQLAPRNQAATLRNIVKHENELLTTGLQFAFTQGVKSLDQVSGRMMRMVGRVAVSPITEELRSGSQELDRLVNGRVQDFRERSLPKIAATARNNAFLENIIPVIANKLGETIPGSIVAGSVGDALQAVTRVPGIKELFQTSGDDFAGRLLTGPTAPIIKDLTRRIGYGNEAEGVEGGIGGLISSLFTTQVKNIPLLNRTAAGKTSDFTVGKGIAASIDMLTPFKPVVENLVLGLTDEVTTGITGALYNTVKSQISEITPGFIKSGYSGVKKLFPDLDKIVFDKFGDTVKTVFKPFARSDFEKEYGKLNKDIDGLTRKLLQTEPTGLDDRAAQLEKEAKRMEAERRLKRQQQNKKNKAKAEQNVRLNSAIVGLLDPSGDLGLSGKTPAGAEKYKQVATGAEASADYASALMAAGMGRSGQSAANRNALLQYLAERSNRRIVQEQMKQLPDNIRDVITQLAGDIYRDPTMSIGDELGKRVRAEVLNNFTSKLPSETVGGLTNAMLGSIIENTFNTVAAAPEYAQKQAYKKEQELKAQAKEMRSQADLARRGQRISGVAAPTDFELRFVMAQLKNSRQDDKQRQSYLQGFGESDQTKALTLELQRMREARSVQRKLRNQENERISDTNKLVEMRSRRRELDAQKEAAYKKAGEMTEYRATVEANPVFSGSPEKTRDIAIKRREIERITNSIPSGEDIAPQARIKRNQLQQDLDLLMVPDSRRETKLYKLDQEIEKILAPYETVPERVGRKLRNFWPTIREALKDPQGIEQLRKVDDFLEGALSEAAEQVMRTSSREAVKGVGQQLIGNMLPAIDAVDSAVLGAVDTVKNIPQRFISSSAATSNFFLGLANTTEPLSALNTIITKVGQVGSSFFMATQQLAMFTSGFQGIAQIIQSSPIGLIIRQSDELEKQTISIQASLVATNKVAKGDLSTNKNESSYTSSSLEGINLSRGQVESGIDRIRQGSLEIANVTSSQLIDPFLNVASLSGVTRMNLDQSAELTLKFAAAMSTLNIPAGQNKQEIQSILRGTIDQNSVLAKTLNISNKQVLKWREQGTLYQNLSDRLKPLQEGQKIAAGTVGGNISNIQELYETTLLNAGKPFMNFLKKEVSGLYESLAAATPQIQQAVGKILEQIIRIASATTKTFKELFGATDSIISPALIVIFKSFANIVDSVANAVQNTIKIMAPAITVFAALAQSALAIGGPFLQLGIQFKVLSVTTGILGGSFGLLARLLPGVGGLLGAVSVRSLPMINTFANLTGKIGAGSAAFLVLGQNMKHIPGLAGLTTQALSRFGPLAPIITSLIGPLSVVGIKASGVAQVFGSLGVPMFFTNLAKTAPAAITAFASIAKNASFLSGNTAAKANIDTVANSLKDYVIQLTNTSQANNLLANSARAVGVEFRNWALSTTLLAGGLYLAFQAVDKFILKNKEGMVIVSGVTSGLQDFAKIVMQIATINVPVTIAILAVLITKGQIVTTVISGLLALLSPLLLKLGFLGVVNDLAVNPTLVNLRALAAVNLVSAAAQTEKLSMALAHLPIIGGLASNRVMALSSALTGLGTVFEVAALKAKAAQAGILAVDAANKLAAASARVSRAEQIGGVSAIGMERAVAAQAAAAQAAQTATANATAAGASLVGAANGAKTLRQSLIGFEAAAAGAFVLKGRITGLAGAIAGAISPLIIIGGLLATIGLAFAEFKLGGTVWGIQFGKGAIQAADEMALTTAEIQGNLQTVTGSIRKARKEQQERTSAGIALTDAEYTANEKLKKQAEAGIASAEQDIEANKKALGKEENEDLKGVYGRNIANAEDRIKDLKAAMGSVDFMPKDIERMGGVLEQLGEKAKQAMQALTTPNGDTELFKKQATALIEVTKQQLELGAITPEAAKERLRLVTENTGLELGIRQQGAQAITDAITIEADRLVEKETESRNVTQQMASEELIGEEKAQRMTTESTLREIDIRMEAERKAYEERSVARIRDTQETINELNKQIKAIQEKLDLSGPNAALALKGQIARLQSESSSVAARQNELSASKANIESSGVDSATEQNEVAKIDAELTELAKKRQKTLVDLDTAKTMAGKSAPVLSEDERKNLEKELVGLNSEKTIAESESKSSLLDIERRHNSKMQEFDAQKAKTKKEELDRTRQEQLKDFDERQKINDSAREQGLKDNQQAAIESVRIAEGRANAELGQIKEKTTKLEAEAKKQGKTVKEYDKEAWEVLQVQQAEALQKLAAARKEGLEKRLSDLKQDAQEATALVEAAQAKNDIDNQQAAVKTATIATKSINNQIALIDREIVASKGNVERLEELNAKKAGLEKDLTEVQKKELQQRLADLQQNADERVAVIKAANATGAIDNQQTAIKTAEIETASSNGQLKLIQDRIAQVVAADKQRGRVSVELLEDLRKQEADTQVKITEITKKEMDARLADLKEDAVERTAVAKAAQATGVIDNQAAAVQTANIERTGAAQRLEIVRKRIEQVADEAKKSGKLNVELMESLKKQKADIQVEMTEIDKKEMESRLADLQQDADERVAVVAAANALGAKDNQEAAIATSQIQQKSANDQLRIVQDRIKAALEEGKKTGKVNVELLEELRKKEADIQVKITEIQKQESQKRLADLREDAEERTAVVVAANATGVIDNQQSAVKIGQIERSSLKDQLALIQERISTANPKNKELLEDLRKQEAEVQTKIAESQKQELDKRIKDLEEDINERTALVESANASGLLDNQQAAIATERIQETGTNKQIALIQKRINEVKAEGVKTKNLNTELLEELQTQEANAQKKLTEIRKQAFQKRLSDLQQDSEEELGVVNSLNAQGVIDNQKAATQSTEIQQQSLMSQLGLIKERLNVVGSSNKELNEELLKQQAELQVKLTEVQEQGFQKQLSDSQQDGEELLAIIVANNIRGLADNQETAIKSAAVQEESAQQQLMLIQERLGQASGELREKLLKLEADTQVKIAEIRKQTFDKRLADVEQDGQEQLAIVNSLNAQGIIDNQKAANQSVDIQRRSLTSQIELIKERLTAIGGSNKELGEELLRQEAELQIKLAEAREQSFQKQLSDLQQDGEERLAIVASNSARGLIDDQEATTESAAIQEASAQRQLTLIRERLNQVSGVSIELREKLLKLEADIQTKITEIQKQELQKRLADLQEDSQERTTVMEAAAAIGTKDNQESAIEIENIQRQSANEQLNLVQERIATTSPLNQELSEELKAQEAKLQKELTEIQGQGFQKRLSDLQQDGEERLAIIIADGIKGLTDNQETVSKSAAIQEKSAQQQLNLIRDRLTKAGALSIELRESLLKQEADTEAKIIEIRKQAFDKQLADVEQDGQERQTILDGQLAQGQTTEAKYAENRYTRSVQSLDAQLALIRERRSQISATDIEGQEALAAQEATLQSRRQEALMQFLDAQLSLLDRENKKATDILEQSELDRRLTIKRAALLGIGDKDAAATAEIQAIQRRIQQEIAMEGQKNVTLRSLPAFSDPAKEAERQSRIRASIKKTTELRLQLLDEESKAFNLLIDRQIKGIQNQSRVQELASDAQVRSIEQQGKQYDLLSRSLENQNKLLQSRASLSNALASYIQGEYKILQDSAGSEGERNRLKKEAADAQLIAMQQQQVVAQKNLDIEIKQAEITQKRAEFEAEIAEIKARAGSAKADAEVLKAEVALQKVRRDPNASNADVEAAKLDVVAARASAEAAVAEIAYAIANKDIVGQNREVLKEQNNLKRETLSIEQATQGRAARATAIEAIVDPREKELSKRELAGRLTPEEAATLARTRQENRMREETQRRDQAERDALAGKPPTSATKRYIRGAETRSASLLEGIKQASTTPPEVPELPKLIAQMNMQRKQITAVKSEANPLIRLQEESTGYQKEMLGVLKQINGRPAPAPVTPVANNFNIKAESGISEAQVLGMFGQVSQQVTQMLKR